MNQQTNSIIDNNEIYNYIPIESKYNVWEKLTNSFMAYNNNTSYGTYQILNTSVAMEPPNNELAKANGK